ncbi:MAG: DUF2293 domain-containing protein [Ilumatobacter sp.]|uniref:DUF2293 domain-containing protein n=1 Tax=Ilumatobacter sp. TaxID=1967498 RepID=UPI00391D692C
MVAQEDPASENLDVYDTKAGWWNPDLGELVVPDGWEFLASGDAFVTRRVKAAGVYWNAWKPKNRRGGHRRRLGLLAPTAGIDAARNAAIETANQRARSRVAGARHRERLEADYQGELRDTVVRWLDFVPEHHDLAVDIAIGTAAQATVVGSGRVGRTRTLSVDERAVLAARAYIRHHHTDYHDRLDNANVELGDDIDDDDYREIKRAAHDEVEAFLDAHRQHHSGGGATVG